MAGIGPGFMRENGARLTSKKANFGGFAVLRHPIIGPLDSLTKFVFLCNVLF